jgi:hypothetical protein
MPQPSLEDYGRHDRRLREFWLDYQVNTVYPPAAEYSGVLCRLIEKPQTRWRENEPSWVTHTPASDVVEIADEARLRAALEAMPCCASETPEAGEAAAKPSAGGRGR